MQTQALPPDHKVKFQAPAEPAFGFCPQLSAHACNLRFWPHHFTGSSIPQAAWMVRKVLPESKAIFSLMQTVLLEHCNSFFFPPWYGRKQVNVLVLFLGSEKSQHLRMWLIFANAPQLLQVNVWQILISPKQLKCNLYQHLPCNKLKWSRKDLS